MARKPIKVELTDAIVVDGKEIKQVEMRVPKVKDLKAVAHLSDEVERESMLISNLTGLNVTTQEVEEWDASSYMQLVGALRAFLS